MNTFEKGKYYIGDLCYVLTDWDAFCDLTIKDKECLHGKFPWKDGKFWTHGTAYGDGTYLDQDGHEYGVDAGLIGCIPFEYCDKGVESIDSLGRIVEFDKPFSCDYEDGVFTIGHIVIDTDPPYEDEEEDEDWDEDDLEDEDD